jgi:serine protease Do
MNEITGRLSSQNLLRSLRSFVANESVIFSLAMISILALAGCNRAPSGTGSDATDKSDDSSQTQADDQQTGDQQATFTPRTRPLVSSEEVPLLEQINRENERVVAAATPSIVRVTAMGLVDPHAQLFGDLPFKIPGMPHNIRALAPSYGSGVIISRDGYVVTNFHVVQDAQSVEVQLRDQRSFPARVVASDEPSDIAVLKIAATDLPALPWGNSDKVEVGEQVFAIGNPFNLDDSVSKGIVSAKGRDLPDSTNYEDYIQTDAAINVGNSGGALINIHGELIGINAAIASFTRGNEGVGFSIPSNLVRYTVEALLKDGRLVRGYLGVRLPVKVDDGVAELLGIDDDRGALLAGVQRSSPADRAKLRPVDFITGVDGHKIDSVAQLRLIVAQIPVGKDVVVNYIRDGAARSTTVKVAELPKEEEVAADEASLPDPGGDSAPASPEGAPPPQGDHVLSGLQVTDLNDKTRQKFGVDDIVTSGVVVTGVQEGSAADAKGLLRGDVIEIACAERGSILPLASAGDFAGLTKKLKADQSVVLLVHHGKTSGPEDRSSMFIYLAPEPK